MRHAVRIGVILVGAAACSCTSGGGSSDRDAGTPTVEQCERVTADTYVAGIEHTSTDGRVHVKILDALPAPPAAGDNTWTLQITGAPTSTRPIVEARSARRDLETSRSPDVTAKDPAAGVFEVQHLVFGVPGPWEVEVTVGADDGGPPAGVVTFTFCVDS